MAKDNPPGSAFRRNLKECWYWLKFSTRIDMAIKEIFQEKKKLEELPNKSGHVAVVTGAARGFGLEVVKKLLQSGFTVYIGDIESGESALEEIKIAGLPLENVEFFSLNLKSLKSVRNFASYVLSKTTRIDLLINNAGIMFAPFQKTEDGFESHFQVNYLGHFLLTNLLLPTIKETAKGKEEFCRIVNTASTASLFTKLNVDTIGIWDDVYASNKAYNDSKLAQVIFTKYLDDKLTQENARIRVYCLHPGIVPSKLWENLPPSIERIMTCFKKYYRTIEDGANGIVFAALSPDLEDKGGIFLDNCTEAKANPQMNDKNLQKILWVKSLKFTDLV